MSNLLDLMNNLRDGWGAATGLRFTSASDELVEAELLVGPQHLQPHGIVHGGVHCGVVESLCSIGATVAAAHRGHQGQVVGLENHTSFIRAVGAGTLLKARATPITRGRTTQVWEATITDPDGAIVATGRVRLLLVAK
ncbi:MAG: PaaI family thioesterase [Deltaproteobacteria bacterium]|nr:PaaI family thioesterase [Deltaproteobacteria bacterium]